jgi:hypothetical protein
MQRTLTVWQLLLVVGAFFGVHTAIADRAPVAGSATGQASQQQYRGKSLADWIDVVKKGDAIDREEAKDNRRR